MWRAPAAPLAQRGHSRDGQKGTLQIAFGLLCTAEGCPVAVEVFEGSTADSLTVASQVAKIRERFGLQQVVLVGDRGMLTGARIREDLQGVDGLRWITTLRAPTIRKLVNAGTVTPSLFDERDLAEVTSEEFPGERLIVCRNPLLAAERQRKRQELLAATEKELAPIVEAVARAADSPCRRAPSPWRRSRRGQEAADAPEQAFATGDGTAATVSQIKERFGALTIYTNQRTARTTRRSMSLVSCSSPRVAEPNKVSSTGRQCSSTRSSASSRRRWSAGRRRGSTSRRSRSYAGAAGVDLPLETGRPQPGGALAHRRLAAPEPFGELPQATAAVLVVERVGKLHRDVLTRCPAAGHRLRCSELGLRATHRE